MQLLRYALLAAAGVLLLAGTACDNAGEQSASGRQTANSTDTAAADGAAAAGDATDEGASPAAQDEASDPAGADDAGTVAKGGDDNDDGEQQLRYYRETRIDFRFLKAEFNPDPEATMSILRFVFDARIARGETVEQEVEVSDLSQLAEAELDLGHSRVKLIPIAATPQLLEQGPLGEYRYRFEGMYRVHLYLPDGTLCAVLAVNSEGELMTAPPEERPEGFNATSRLTRDMYGPRKYQVYRSVEKGETAEILYTVQWRGAGFQTLEVVSPDEDIYEYRFPEGRLVVRKGDDKDDERPKPRDPEEDYED
jgi:hypothetical protein